MMQRLGYLTLIIICSSTLVACQSERFRHEKYACNLASLDLAAIIINKTSIGDPAKIIGYRNERTAKITAINDKAVSLNLGAISLDVNRDTGRVKIIQGKLFSRISCTKTVFKM